jgi:hypothetical protein
MGYLWYPLGNYILELLKKFSTYVCWLSTNNEVRIYL